MVIDTSTITAQLDAYYKKLAEKAAHVWMRDPLAQVDASHHLYTGEYLQHTLAGRVCEGTIAALRHDHGIAARWAFAKQPPHEQGFYTLNYVGVEAPSPTSDDQPTPVDPPTSDDQPTPVDPPTSDDPLAPLTLQQRLDARRKAYVAQVAKLIVKTWDGPEDNEYDGVTTTFDLTTNPITGGEIAPELAFDLGWDICDHLASVYGLRATHHFSSSDEKSVVLYYRGGHPRWPAK